MERRSDTSPICADGGYQVQTYYRDEPPTFALLRAIAGLKGCAMRDLPSAWEALNGEALNRLMGTAASSEQEVTVEVNFEDYTAVVRDDGTITVHETDAAAELDESRTDDS